MDSRALFEPSLIAALYCLTPPAASTAASVSALIALARACVPPLASNAASAIFPDSDRRSTILPVSGPGRMPAVAMAIPQGPNAKAAARAARPEAVMPVVARVKAPAATVLDAAAVPIPAPIWAPAAAALRMEADIRLVVGTARAVAVFRPATAVAEMAV